MTDCMRSFALGKLTPWLFRCRVLAGDFSCDEAFCDVASFQIQVAVDGTNLARDIKPRDWLLHRVEHPLLDVVLGTALRVVHDRPRLDDVEGRFGNWHHGSARTFVVLVLVFATE